MCSNFEAVGSLKLIAEHYAKSVTKTAEPDHLNIRPTDETLVVTEDQINYMSWGFKVDWSKQPLINARSESLFEKKTFQSIVNNRCLVPAQAYYEWRKANDQKFKNRISIKDIACFSFAGLYQDNRFTILTCAPSKAIEHIHSRMPVLIHPSFYNDWLDQTIATQDLKHMMSAPDKIIFDIEENRPNHEQFSLFLNP